MLAERPYDIVLDGATGFTGGLTGEYLANHAPTRARWALAGGSAAKPEALRTRLSVINTNRCKLRSIVGDIGSAAN